MFGDLFLANLLGGDRIKLVISADEMNVSKTVQKVKSLISLFGRDKATLKSLKATTIHDDIEEPLDLLTDKFSDFRDIELVKGEKITESRIMDTLNEIFKAQQTLILTTYINSDTND